MTDTVYTKDNVKVGDVFTLRGDDFRGAGKVSYEILYVGETLLFTRSNKPEEVTFSYNYVNRYLVKKKKVIKAPTKYVPVWKGPDGAIYINSYNYESEEKRRMELAKLSHLVDWIEVNYEKEV